MLLGFFTAADCCCFWTKSGQGVLGVVFGLAVVLLAGNADIVISTGLGVVAGFLVVTAGFLVVAAGFLVVTTGFLVVC